MRAFFVSNTFQGPEFEGLPGTASGAIMPLSYKEAETLEAA